MASRRATQHTFTARLQTVSMGVPFHVVIVPAAVSASLGTGRVHVVGTVNGAHLQTSLTPVEGGGHRLFLNRRVREAAGLAPGDRLKVVLERDVAPREEPIPDDLADALREAGVLDAFQRLARSTRNEIIRWIEDARTEPTREKRIRNAVERSLAAREREIDREVRPRR
jgi:PAS domain-containing protein